MSPLNPPWRDSGDCDAVLERMTDWLPQGDDPRYDPEVVAHLARCAECRAWVQAMQPALQWMVVAAEPVRTAPQVSGGGSFQRRRPFQRSSPFWPIVALLAGLCLATGWGRPNANRNVAGLGLNVPDPLTPSWPRGAATLLASEPDLVRGLQNAWRWTALSTEMGRIPQSHGSRSMCCLDCHGGPPAQENGIMWEALRQTCNRCHPMAGPDHAIWPEVG